MQFGEDRPVRVRQGGQQASIQPVARIPEEPPWLQARVPFVNRNAKRDHGLIFATGGSLFATQEPLHATWQ